MEYTEALSLLGLDSDFSEEDVKKSHKLKMKDYHPDKPNGNNEAMSELNGARDLLLNNNLLVVEKLEIALKDMNQLSLQQKAIDKKVERFEKRTLKYATNKLQRYRRIAILLAGISTAAIFLGKDLPKDLLMEFHQIELVKPASVSHPALNELTRKYKSLRDSNEKNAKSTDLTLIFTAEEITEIEKYEADEKKFIEHLSKINAINKSNRDIKTFNKNITLYWYVFTFGLGMQSAIVAWFFNNKIHKIEDKLADISDALLIKSNFIKFMYEIFKGEIPKNWTLQQFENALLENKEHSNCMGSMTYTLGHRKIAQLVILKGQEGGFISVIDGNESNNYLEAYYLV